MVVILAVPGVGVAKAQCTTEWAAPVDGDWTDDSKWTNGVPGSGDDACLGGAGTYTVTLNANATINRLSIGGSGGSGATQTLLNTIRTLTLNASSTIGSSGVLDWQGGYLAGTELTNNGLIRINGTSTKTLDGPFTLHNDNVISLAGSGALVVRDNAIVNTSSSAAVDFVDDTDINAASGGGDLVFAGTLRKSGGSGVSSVATSISVVGGEIDVLLGTLEIREGEFDDANLNAASGATLRFTSNAAKVFDGTTTGSPAGHIQWNGKINSVADGAVVNVGGNGIEWLGGDIIALGADAALITNRGNLHLGGNAVKTIRSGSKLINESVVTATGPGPLAMRDNSFFENASGAVFEILDDVDFSYAAGGGSFENRGTLRKTGGTGVTSLPTGFRVINEPGALIDAASGTLSLGYLDLRAGSTLRGTASFDAPTTTNFLQHGTIAPGASPGIMQYIGTFDPDTPDAILNIELGGLTPGTDHDQLVITGTAALGGILELSLEPGYVPAVGNSYVVMTTTGSISGEFDAVATPPGVEVAVDVNSNDVTVTVTSVSIPTSDLAVTKTVDAPTATVGEEVTFTITLTNNGPDAASGIEVLDAPPPGFVFGTPSASIGSYSSNTGIWEIAALGNGASATLTIPATAVGEGLLTNTASIAASEQLDLTVENNTAEATVTVTAAPTSADLSVTTSVDNADPYVGQTVVFTVTLTNNGPDLATGVRVLDTEPAGVAFGSSVASSGSYDGGTGLWLIDNLPSGANATLTIPATVTGAGLITNTASIDASDQADPVGNNNTASVSVNAVAPAESADVAITQSVTLGFPVVGESIVFTVELWNNGPDEATGVQVQITPPPSAELTSTMTTSGTYDGATNVWSASTLPPTGVVHTLELTVRALQPGEIRNVVKIIASDQVDPDPNNNEGTQITTAVAPVNECVTTLADSGPGSLRQCIADAAPREVISFAVTGTIVLTSGQLVIDKPLTLEGPGRDMLSVSGNNESRVLRIAGAGAGLVTITGLTVTGGLSSFDSAGTYTYGTGIDFEGPGTLFLENVNVNANTCQSLCRGVGISVRDGELRMSEVRVDNNVGGSSSQGGGVYLETERNAVINLSQIDSNQAFTGAGIFAQTVTLLQIGASSVSGNEGLDESSTGVGLFVQRGGPIESTTEILDADINDNYCSATSHGPGGSAVEIYGRAVVFGSEISRNQCGVGLLVQSGTVTESDIADNKRVGVRFWGGTSRLVRSTVRNNGGWGVGMRSPKLTIESSTISGNQSLGVRCHLPAGGFARIHNSTIVDNHQSGIAGYCSDLKSNIIAGNSIEGSLTATNADCWFAAKALPENVALISAGHNVFGARTGCVPNGVNDNVIAPSAVFTSMLGPLADNGGPTLTHALLDRAANVAIDRGSCTGETQDQRGLARPVGLPDFVDWADGCDVGATELQSATTPAVADLRLAITADETSPVEGSELTMTLTLTNDGPTTATGVTVSARIPSNLAYLSSTVGAGTYDGVNGVWTVGSLATSAAATLAIRLSAAAPGQFVFISEVAFSEQQDPDSSPGNGATNEDDRALQSGQVEPLPPALDFVVTSGGDDPDASPGDNVCATASGTCTLRAAIQEANTRSTASIGFDIVNPGINRLIIPQSPLPDLTSEISIDGTTLPNFHQVLLGGWEAGTTTSGITIRGDRARIQGFRINGFGGAGIHIVGDHAQIDGNSIGTNEAGFETPGNASHGIRVEGSYARIGSLQLGNTIGNNGGAGIELSSSVGTVIIGNYIGTDRGASSIGNLGPGIHIHDGNQAVIHANVIANNGGSGVQFSGAASVDNAATSNLIGIARIDPDLTTPDKPVVLVDAGNAGPGISVSSGVTRTTIGGNEPAEGNLIGANEGAQVTFEGNANTGSNFSDFTQNVSIVSVGLLSPTNAGKQESGDRAAGQQRIVTQARSRARAILAQPFSVRGDAKARMGDPTTNKSNEGHVAPGRVGVSIAGGDVRIGQTGGGNVFIGFDGAAVTLTDAVNVQLTGNSFSENTAAIKTQSVDSIVVASNIFIENCSALVANESSMGFFTNEVRTSTCSAGALVLEASTGNIEGNLLSENGADAIVLFGGSNPVIRTNNIYANGGFGVRNDDPGVVVAANGNFWGHANGPAGAGGGGGQDGVSSGVAAEDWLDAPVSVFATPASPQPAVRSGVPDTVLVYLANWAEADDAFDIVATDDRGWLAGAANWSVPLEAYTSAELRLAFAAPDGTNGETSTIELSVTSASGAQSTFTFSVRATDGTSTGVDAGPIPDAPSTVALLPNYPNPFGSRTTLSFSVPEQMRVRLVILDLLGREVATAVEDDVAAGVHPIPFDATSLPSGVYFYHLETADRVLTKAMTHTK